MTLLPISVEPSPSAALLEAANVSPFYTQRCILSAQLSLF